MAINYSLVKLASKFGDKAGVPKFYARAQMNESISLKKFAKLISMQTTVFWHPYHLGAPRSAWRSESLSVF